MTRSSYPAELRRRVLDLLEDSRSVASVPHDLDIREQTIYTWRRQDRADRGEQAGLRTQEKAELTAANKRIAALDTELRLARRAIELLKETTPPKGGSLPSR